MKQKFLLIVLISFFLTVNASDFVDSLAKSVQIAKVLHNVPKLIDDQSKPPVRPTAQDKAAQAAELRAGSAQVAQAKAGRPLAKTSPAKKSKPWSFLNKTKTPEPKVLFKVSEGQSRDGVLVIQLTVPQQQDKKAWPKDMQNVAALEGGNCGYYALWNVMRLANILESLPADARCDFRGSLELKNDAGYLMFMQQAFPLMVQSRTAREAGQLTHEKRQEANLQSTQNLGQEIRSKSAKAFKPETPEEKERRLQSRVEHWKNNPTWLLGNEMELLQQLLMPILLEPQMSILTIEYLENMGYMGYIRDVDEQAIDIFLVGEPGAMLGFVWNDGLRDKKSGKEKGLHWIGLVAVKCVDSIVLYVMDSLDHGKITNVEHAVQTLLREREQPDDNAVMYGQMLEEVAGLGHEERTTPATIPEIINPILKKWQTTWLPKNIQIEFLMLLQNAVARATLLELEALINNVEQLRINLTQKPYDSDESDESDPDSEPPSDPDCKKLFNTLLELIEARLLELNTPAIKG